MDRADLEALAGRVEAACPDCNCTSCVCFDYDENECWNCGGEGFVSNCFSEYACIYPDEGCDECTRPCDVCTPARAAALGGGA